MVIFSPSLLFSQQSCKVGWAKREQLTQEVPSELYEWQFKPRLPCVLATTQVPTPHRLYVF